MVLPIPSSVFLMFFYSSFKNLDLILKYLMHIKYELTFVQNERWGLVSFFKVNMHFSHSHILEAGFSSMILVSLSKNQISVSI
jgi:hypothetical protein